MKRFFNTSWIALLFAAILFSGCASENKTLTEQSFRLHSDYAITGDFLIRVNLPQNYDKTDRSYPVLYMTDADWFYGTASDMAHMLELEGKDFILVGIGYGDKASCREKRLKDMGSDLNADGIPAYTLYQSFLKDELFPEIESRYRALSTNRTYYGWSLGALFANHLLYEQRDLFDNYILGGGRFPMYWSEHMKNSVRQAKNDRPLSLYVGFPGRDASQEDYINMITSLTNEDLADLFLQWDIYPNQGHDIESAADALWKGMRYTFSPKGIEGALVERYKRAGLDNMLASFEQWKVLRPGLTDYSPIALLSFAKYLDTTDRQKLKTYIDTNYPPKTLTFQLKTGELPATSTVCITGNHPAIGFWNPSAVAMEQLPDGQWQKSLDVMSGTRLEYKFTLGSWETEALSADGSTLPNFSLTVEKDTVISVLIPGWKLMNN
jgi:predicted alpha/beta superfamily hydrolase